LCGTLLQKKKENKGKLYVQGGMCMHVAVDMYQKTKYTCIYVPKKWGHDNQVDQ